MKEEAGGSDSSIFARHQQKVKSGMDHIFGSGSLTLDIITIAVVALAIWMFFRRRRKRQQAKKAEHDVDIAYEYVSDAAGDDDLRVNFNADSLEIADRADGSSLTRLALLNRGKISIDQAAFQRSITVEWPAGTDILDIHLSENDGAPNGIDEPTVEDGRLIIKPFMFQSGGRIVVNLVTLGPAGPIIADGWFDGQGGLYRLSAGRPRAWST